MWIVAMLGTIVGGAVVPSVMVYWPELFPTSLRGQANGVVSMTAMAGSVVGLLVIGVLADTFGTFAPTMPFVAIGPILMAALIVARFPETAHRELEDINPEDRPGLDSRDRAGTIGGDRAEAAPREPLAGEPLAPGEPRARRR
jgi:MFS family permease